MSVENEQEIEEVIEKEISLAKGNKINSEGNALAEPKFQPKFILKMKESDKVTIIANYQNGINQPFKALPSSRMVNSEY